MDETQKRVSSLSKYIYRQILIICALYSSRVNHKLVTFKLAIQIAKHCDAFGSH